MKMGRREWPLQLGRGFNRLFKLQQGFQLGSLNPKPTFQ
jgi:hypothetical protein